MKMLVTLGKGQVRDSFFTPKVWEKLQAMGEVVCNETDRQAPTKEELKELIRDVDVVFTGWGTPLWMPKSWNVQTSFGSMRTQGDLLPVIFPKRNMTGALRS